MDIYAAGEQPIPGVTSEALAERHSRRRAQERGLFRNPCKRASNIC